MGVQIRNFCRIGFCTQKKIWFGALLTPFLTGLLDEIYIETVNTRFYDVGYISGLCKFPSIRVIHRTPV